MPGDDWQKFANLRAYYGFMWGYPGKKLLFMGQEFAPVAPSGPKQRALDWHLLDVPAARAACSAWCATSTSSTATSRRCMPRDCEGEGFEWLDRRRRRELGLRLAAQGAGRAAGRGGLQLHAGAARRTTASPLPAAGPLARDPQHRCRALWRQRAWATSGGVDAHRGAQHGQPVSAVVTLPPLATICARAGPD